MTVRREVAGHRPKIALAADADAVWSIDPVMDSLDHRSCGHRSRGVLAMFPPPSLCAGQGQLSRSATILPRNGTVANG